VSIAAAASDNARKHTSRNPLQRLLIERFHASLMRLLDGLEFSTVLDAGSGEGFTLARLSARYRDARLMAVDRDLTALRYCDALPVPASRVCADLTHLPYRDRAFDLVLVTEVLEHVDRPIACLRELHRVTRRYVVSSVPNEPYFRLANLLRGKNVGRLGDDRGHVQHWSRRQFADLVGGQLRVLRCTTSFPWTVLLAARRD
jgi:SAM-dependent methyltransferase